MYEMADEENSRAGSRGWRPHHLAWGVMLAGTCASILLCATVSLYVYSYFFRSTTPVSALLQVTRGTVGITAPASLEESVVRDRRNIDSFTSVSTDEQSLGTLSFRDEQETLYAQITLREGTRFVLNRSVRPRFSMGGNYLEIVINQLSGAHRYPGL